MVTYSSVASWTYFALGTGGGITGMVFGVSGAGTVISGSTCDGGLITPLFLSSFSLRLSWFCGRGFPGRRKAGLKITE